MAKKSYTKRIKITKSGKLLRRKQGLGHNKAKKKGKATRQLRNLKVINKSDRTNISERLTK